MKIVTTDKEGALDIQGVGRAVAEFRELRGLSLGDVADLAGIARSYIHTLERGEAPNPGLRTLDAIARALDITLYDLLAAAGHRVPGGDAPGHSETAELARMLTEAPTALREFIKELEQKEGGTLPLDVLRTLLSIRLRGKQPEAVEDWRYAYDSLQRAIR